MGELIMCGICLNMDVKMYKLRGYPLEDYYTRIIGSLLETNISPYFQYACYECAYHILKYNTFREKCLRSQSVLFEILEEKDELTKSDINSVDRQKSQLCSNLTYNVNTQEIEHINIKQESNISSASEMVETPTIVMELNEIKIDYNSQEEENEMIISNLNHNEYSMASIDDKEPLKTLKRKKTHYKDVKRSDKKQTEGSGENSKDEARGLKLKTLKGITKPKRDENGLTSLETSMADRLEIINLTLEEQLEELVKRKESSNFKKSEYKCDICYKGFVDPDAFDFHMKRHDPASGPNICPICKICFQAKRSLQRHRLGHEKVYKCKRCPHVCNTMTQVKLHQNEHEGKTYTCQHCGYVTKKWTSRFTHIRLKHPSQYVCDICGFSFVSEFGLKRHKTRHRFELESESSSIKTYCKTCDVHCNSQQTWKNHIATVAHKIKISNDLKCDKCNEVFTTDEELRSHHRKLHPKKCGRTKKNPSSPKNWPSKCPHCDETMLTVLKYYFHLRKTHPDKPYPIAKNHICDICGKSFVANAILQDHKRTHFEERHFKCTECPKSFFNKVNLQEHKISHSDARPFVCKICHKAFKTNGNLQKHLMSHTGERPYSCKYCGKAFIESSSRRIHIMTVHFKQPAPYRRPRRRRHPPEKPINSL